ncbi:MAG: hypothetical protein QM718_08775 [Steroidobacteraceae bacterium]
MSRRRTQSKYPLAELTKEQKQQLDDIERKAILDFQGSLDDLERAIGLLRLGHHLGWKPLVLMHSKRTIAKYEDILDIKFSEIFPATGSSASRSLAYTFVQGVSNFWKAVSGEIPVADRKTIQR